jgi:hypothetical protein
VGATPPQRAPATQLQGTAAARRGQLWPAPRLWLRPPTQSAISSCRTFGVHDCSGLAGGWCDGMLLLAEACLRLYSTRHG